MFFSRNRAPAYYQISQDISSFDLPNECILGILPHSIRGFLSTFSHVLPATERYQQCIACSNSVLEAYKTIGFDFLLKVFESCKYLEDITGLTILHNTVDQEQVLLLYLITKLLDLFNYNCILIYCKYNLLYAIIFIEQSRFLIFFSRTF